MKGIAESGMVKEAVHIGFEDLDPSLSNRILLFLDTNIWINLAERKSEAAEQCAALLAKAVSSGKLLCPLAAPLLWELYKQNYPSALRVAALMDQLSLSTSFASSDEIHTAEIRQYLRNILNDGDGELPVLELLVPVVSYLSSDSVIEFSDWWSEENRRKVTDQLRSAKRAVTVTQLIEMRKDSLPQLERPEPPPYAEALRRRADYARGDRKKAWFVEAYSIFCSTVLPKLNNLRSPSPIADQIKIVAAGAQLPLDDFKSRLVPLFERLPSLLVRAEVMTLSGFDTCRKDSMRDFYDMEMLTVPFTYSHAFASEDRWIRHIVKSPPVIMADWPTRLLSNMAEVAAFAKSLS